MIHEVEANSRIDLAKSYDIDCVEIKRMFVKPRRKFMKLGLASRGVIE